MIPRNKALRRPILEACAEGMVHGRALVALLVEHFDLSDMDASDQEKFYGRVGWTKTSLKMAGLIHYPQRGYAAITEEGREVLQSGPEIIDKKFLMQFESFREFQARKGTRASRDEGALSASTDDETTPDEALQQAYTTLRRALAADLLERVRNAPPDFFEGLIIRLLVAMGYGGASAEAGRALGRSGDDGVDGVIDQDALGVDQVYLQAKRYQQSNNIGAGAIRDFFGALNLKKAQKGIFFTTSGFSADARMTAEKLGLRIVLIDGERLAELMIDYDIGCREEQLIRLKKVDEEFFPEEEQAL